MHEHHIAHRCVQYSPAWPPTEMCRDCMESNIMYDPRPTYPNMYHPQMSDRSYDFKGKAKHLTRTTRPVKYYYIDFGMSIRYNPEDGPPREHPMVGGDKSVPEFKNWTGELLDPFPTDIYYIGNMVRNTVMRVRLHCPRLPDLLTSCTPRRDTGGLNFLPHSLKKWCRMIRLGGQTFTISRASSM